MKLSALCTVGVLVNCWSLLRIADATETVRLFPHLRKGVHHAAHHAHHPKVHRVTPPAAPVVATQVVDTLPATTADVPAAPDLGSKGFPELPGVSSMLTSATEKAKTMSSEAGVLQASIARAQQENEAKLAMNKHVYEKKLRVQEARNKAAIALNAKVSEHISKLKEENDALRNTSTQIRETNLLMKSEWTALKERLGTARAFVSSAIVEFSESKAEVTAKVGAHKQVQKKDTIKSSAVHTDEDEDEDEDDEDDDSETNSTTSASGHGTSFLALGQTVHLVSPEDEVAAEEDDDSATKIAKMDANDLLSVLQKGVASLQAEEKKSEAHLKEMFLNDYKVGAERHAALLAEQKKLNGTEANLESLQIKLMATKKKLEGTNTKSQKKLRTIGSFLQKLKQLATATPTEAMQLIDDMPNTVA